LSTSVLAVTVAPAIASTGGTAPPSGGSTSTSTSTSATPGTTPSTVYAPVTSRSPNLTYRGPVYEKTTTGQIVPYVAPAPIASTSTTSSSATFAGGSVAGTPSTSPGTPTTPSSPAVALLKPELLVPGTLARVVDGQAAAPMSAPLAVQEMIWAGNQLIGLPYIYGGGHASFIASGYDCSGTVSFALHGASLLSSPEDSSELMRWGSSGIGAWVSIFSNPEHAYMDVAGIRLDTSSAYDPSNLQGPRWRPLRRNNRGYRVRHPTSL
jgi:cell wall-associated NlpC family hydrolase